MLPVPADLAWFDAFMRLRKDLAAALGGLAVDIHHVGSTSIPGLIAKPILDVDIEIRDDDALDEVRACLANLGYEWQGDRGIADRHAFRSPPCPAGTIPHHLYVCPARSAELARHLHFRDRLNTDPGLRARYAALKARCMAEAAGDHDRYVELKTQIGADFFEEALAEPPDLAGLRIRRLQTADPEALAAAFADMNKTLAQFVRYLAENHAGTRLTLVAEVDGRILGYTNLIWTPDYEPFAQAGIPEISDMNTITHMRRRGIGTRMLAAAEATARAFGYSLIGIGVGLTPDYAIAQRLYPKLGYVPDGRGVRPDPWGGCLYATKPLRHAVGT